MSASFKSRTLPSQYPPLLLDPSWSMAYSLVSCFDATFTSNSVHSTKAEYCWFKETAKGVGVPVSKLLKELPKPTNDDLDENHGSTLTKHVALRCATRTFRFNAFKMTLRG